MSDDLKLDLLIDRDFEPLRERTLKILRKAIASNLLTPGQRLVERSLCEQMGVSRSSIREALRYLESEGLIDSRGQKGMFVAVLSRKKALEIYEVRETLEADAARFFTERASDDEMIALRRAYDRIADVAQHDPEDYGTAIDEFFEVLFTGARNNTSHALIRTLRSRIHLLRYRTALLASKERITESVAQMEKIVVALEKRDAETAAIECRRFVKRSAAFAAAILPDETD